LYSEEKTKTAGNLFTTTNHAYELQRLQNNTYASEVNSIVVKNLQQDIYIEETFRILTDLIQYTPK
jgi:hypothetical protein